MTLPHIKISLGEKILMAMMIRENLTMEYIQVVLPQLQSKNNHTQLYIMGRVISLIGF